MRNNPRPTEYLHTAFIKNQVDVLLYASLAIQNFHKFNSDDEAQIVILKLDFIFLCGIIVDDEVPQIVKNTISYHLSCAIAELDVDSADALYDLIDADHKKGFLKTEPFRIATQFLKDII